MKYIKTYEETNDKSLIEELVLSYEDLTELKDLSEYTNLKKLFCYNNQLTFLPELPKKLEELYCYNNKLTSLPELPETLEYLYCYNNQLISLPELPKNIECIYCNRNKLKSLPELPNKLRNLYCENNKLTSLPELPDTLYSLCCHSNQLPFINLDGYKEWYKENEQLIDKEGLEYAYKLSNDINIYNV